MKFNRRKIIFITLSSLFSLSLGYWAYHQYSNPNKPAVEHLLITKDRLADREYVASVLTEVFGPHSASIVTAGVLTKIDIFGGPCDPNTEITNRDGHISNPNCTRKLLDEKVKFIPKNTILRQMSMLSVCEKLVTNAETLAFAVNKNQTSFPAFDEQHRKAIYEKFYPLSDIKMDLKNSLPKTKSIEQKWQKWVLALCISPQWQVL